MTIKFQPKIEDFVCGHCGAKAKGNGYTNHCLKCLYSKHVDINPGDRAESCGGMMEPINFEIIQGQYTLIHQCQKCGTLKRNKMQANDNFEVLPGLAQNIAKKAMF